MHGMRQSGDQINISVERRPSQSSTTSRWFRVYTRKKRWQRSRAPSGRRRCGRGGRGIWSHRAHWSVAPAHQARIAPRLDRAPQPVRIGHEFVHGERRRTGERVLGASVARASRALHGRSGAGARPRRTKIIIIKLFWFWTAYS